MLTPFHEDGSVDFDGLDRLTDWYLRNGADALFAVCQSSEMPFLTLEEKVAISRRVVSRVAGRVPVVASGHTSESPEAQLEETAAVADTGVDAVVLVTSRLDPGNEGGATYRRRLDALLSRLPEEMPLGLYECPWPYRRLLTDAELVAAARSGRFVVLKDVSCDLAIVTRRLALVAGTPLAIVNANAAIAFDAMKAGSQGFCGVFNNFHPDLYAWLYRHADEDAALAEDLASFLALSAMAENLGYPAVAKLFHRRLRTFASARCRAIDYDPGERFWALEPTLDIIAATADRFRQRIAARG
jgi:4-hydroxy-tetrahydrodipicolinate synthase